MYNKALAFRDSHIRKADTWEEFQKLIEEPGFISAHWDGTSETEEKDQRTDRSHDPLHTT
jgi:prolyl-tRNA synthetase